MNLAFIGLGVMGYPMAGHLQNAGHQVCVFNRTTTKAEQWLEQYQGQMAKTPKEATAQADMIFICVGNDDDVRSVCYGEQAILAGLSANKIVIDHTTTSAELAKELKQAINQHDADFLDAPVSGGEAGAVNGQLTIMVGGKQQTFQQAKTIMQVYAKNITLLGETGSGQLCKMVNQLCIAGILQGLSEGITLGQKAGLDITQVKDVLTHGAAQSWQMDHRATTMAQDQFDFGFAIDWMIKDLKICLAEAEQHQLQLPLAEKVLTNYQGLQQQGLNRCDTSVLIKNLKSLNNS